MCVCVGRYRPARVCLDCVKWGWLPPESQTLTAVSLAAGGREGGVSSFDKREGITLERAGVSKIDGEVERRGGREGKRVSDSGIRQLGQAALAGS